MDEKPAATCKEDTLQAMEPAKCHQRAIREVGFLMAGNSVRGVRCLILIVVMAVGCVIHHSGMTA
ncbi:hypothetical protein LIPSTDRAFT_131713 [Lipomyces starkeyi NRRL Y-11557]|uniref:Uncharacterized protein n=1 Tax=Lipomyces starkeyi NRRL Y-11557 TaxID=675824 RepID=A0A1E3QFE8_LIPST|nr:hypothetical protein LIPSTDRAFT_131713 [Lipomyces starkeyi NRRL Y-11557]